MKIDLGQWKIREYREADLSRILQFAGNRNVSRNLKDSFPYPYRESDGRRWLDYVHCQDPTTHFCIASAEGLIGSIGLERKTDIYRKSAEMHAPPIRRRIYGPEY